VSAVVIDTLDPCGEQPVHLGQVGHPPSGLAVAGGDLDGELTVHGAEQPLDLPAALGLSG
jgi:hypothetical protein